MIKDYNYYKQKYKAVTIRLDREADKDVISFLEQWPDGPKDAIVKALRIFRKFMRGGLGV